jgi:hypothetical protein
VAFIRTKSVKGHKYYQVVENYRDKERNGKHRQRVIHHLGKYTSVEQKLRTLRTKEAGERRAATARFDEVANWIERQGRQILESQEGRFTPTLSEDPVASLVQDSLSRIPDGYGMKDAEFRDILGSVATQTGLSPAEVNARWREERRREYDAYSERIRSVGQQSMPSKEETLSRHLELIKKFRKWEKERDAGRLTQEEVREGRAQIDNEWSQGLYIAVGYHKALISAEEHKARADDYQEQINELLEIHQKYF